MNDDFHTAKAITVLFDMVPVINQLYQDRSGPFAVSEATFTQFKTDFQTAFYDILGLGLPDAGDNSHELLDGLIGLVNQIRQRARADKNWPTADLIRDELARLGVELQDTPQGTEWSLIN